MDKINRWHFYSTSNKVIWPLKNSNYKCHFDNFSEGRDGRALLVWPSKIPCWISKNIFVLGSYEFLAMIESKLEKALSFRVQSGKKTSVMYETKITHCVFFPLFRFLIHRPVLNSEQCSDFFYLTTPHCEPDW